MWIESISSLRAGGTIHKTSYNPPFTSQKFRVSDWSDGKIFQAITSKEDFERIQPTKLVLSPHGQNLNKKQTAPSALIPAKSKPRVGVCNEAQALGGFHIKLRLKKKGAF